MKNLPKIAMGAWAWGDTDGYFGNTMTGEDFRPIFDAAVKAGLNCGIPQQLTATGNQRRSSAGW